MESWKESFAQRLQNVQSTWTKQFERALDDCVVPEFEELATFVRQHNFTTAMPLHEEGKRSFKFELAENAYLLMIFRSTGIGEFELRAEAFAPGQEPGLSKASERLAEVDREWARQQFQNALDGFINHLNGGKEVVASEAELVSA